MRKTLAVTARRLSPQQATPTAKSGQPSPLGANTATPLLLDRADLARELRTSVKTINRMIAAGGLPSPITIGKRRRWPRQTIVEWIAAKCPSGEDFRRMTSA